MVQIAACIWIYVIFYFKLNTSLQFLQNAHIRKEPKYKKFNLSLQLFKQGLLQKYANLW